MTNTLLSALANGLILGTIATIVISLVLRLTPRTALNAATRHAVLWFALLFVAALPLVLLLPTRNVQRAAIPVLGALPLEELARFPVASMSGGTLVAQNVPPVSDAQVSVPASRNAQVVGAPRSLRLPTFPLRVQGGWWLDAILGVWCLATLILLVRLAASYVTLSERSRRAADVPEALRHLADNWAALGRVRRGPVRVAVSDEIDTPLAIGLGRPSILIPSDYLARFTHVELEQICVHEAAHIARGDDLTLLVQRLVEAIIPWHPAIRWIGHNLDVEREIACDDYVISATGRLRDYAECLIRVAELGSGPEAVLATPTVIGTKSDLARRIDALLEQRRSPAVRLLKGRFVVFAALLIGFTLLSGRGREMIAFAQAGALRGLTPQVQMIADAALDAPPELAADVLLLLVERGQIVDPKQKRQAVQNAWDLAPKAKHLYEIHGAVGSVPTESGISALRTALGPGLSAAGLQLRAIRQMAVLDPQAAREMFGGMIRPEPESPNCTADRYASHAPYFEALELTLKTFPPENTRPGERTQFLKNALRSLTNPDDLRLSLALLQADKTLSDSDFVELLHQWSGTLAQSTFTDRVFSATRLIALANPVIAAAQQAKARGGYPDTLLRALRSYIVRHTAAVRCEDSLERRATPDPETARLAFNTAASELAPDILPIRAEEIIPVGTGGRATVIQYINWFAAEDGSVSPEVARNRELLEAAKGLNLGTPEQLAANAQRTGVPNEPLTLEERSTPEWNAEALRFLNQVENWYRGLTQSNAEVFFQKAFWYRILVEKVPNGRLRDTLLKSYVTFLATSPAQRESPPEWHRWVNALIGYRDVGDRRQWLDQIEAAGDKTIGVYCKLARLALDSDQR